MHSGAKLPPRGAAKSARGVGPGAPGSRPQQKKSMAKQKDSMGRCTVRPQRAKDGSVDKNVPRSRSNKGNLTELYALLHARVPFDSPTEEALARVFSDKELRVLMGMNKMLINDFDPKTGKYTEKTKQNKIKVLLPSLTSLVRPEDLDKSEMQSKRPSRVSTPPVKQNATPPTPDAQEPSAAPAGFGLEPAEDPEDPVDQDDGSVSPADVSEPDSPLVDPVQPPAPGWDSGSQVRAPDTLDLYEEERYNFDFAPNFGLSPDKIVTALELPQDVPSNEAINASGYVCAAMAVHFSASCRERRSPRNESADHIQREVLQVGVDAYRRSSAGEQGEPTRMDEVVADEFLGQSLRIVDVRAFSRSLRYPSTLDIVVSQLEQSPGGMATFLYGHANFRDIQRTGATLFIGHFGKNSDGESIFVAMDPRSCHSDTGFPDLRGNPAMLVFLSAAELRQHLETLLRGEGGDDLSIVDWQASFLEALPAEAPGPAATSSMEESDPWFAATAGPIDAPECLELDAPPSLDVELPAEQSEGPGTPKAAEGVSRDSVESAVCCEMDELEEQLKRSSLDEDSLEVSMQRTSLDDLDEVLPPLAPATEAPLEHSVQQAIEVETAKQASMMAWESQMNARMLKSRQEHERRQRLKKHASQQPRPATAPSKAAGTPPDEAGSRKRRGMGSQLGAAIRKRGPRSLRKGKEAEKTAVAAAAAAAAAPTSFSTYTHTTMTPHAQDISASSAPEVQAPASAAPTKEHTQTTRYYARRESRDVVLEVTPTGISIIDGESQFFHLTTILSWRVRRSEAGQPVGFKLVFTDGTEMVFSTDQGREISDTMMAHAQGLAALMHNGMHVRGTAMVN